MRVVITRDRRAKVASDGMISNLISPGAGQSGLFGKLGQGFGLAGALKNLGQPDAEAETLEAKVQAQKDMLERYATVPEIQRSGLDQQIRLAQKSEEQDASNLATLIDAGISPEAAHAQISSNKMQRNQQVANLLGGMDRMQTNLNLQQKALTDQAYAGLREAQLEQEMYDIAGKRADKTAGLFDLGTQFTGMEDFFNPQAAGVKSSARGYKHGGITPGPHDHDVLNLVISHEDGTPAVDQDGDEMHVTGSEAIIPDYIFDELMSAAKAGDKNALFEIFMDEIATEERFQG